MSMLLKVAYDYHPIDAITDPPVARNRKERRARGVPAVAGMVGGLALGATAGHLTGIGALKGSMAGGALGAAAGNIAGNRNVYKMRMRSGQALDTTQENRLKQENQSKLPGAITALKMSP